MQYTSSLRLESTRVHLFKLLQDRLKNRVVSLRFASAEILDPLLQLCDFLLRSSDDILDCVDVAWLGFSVHHIDVDMRRNFDVSLGDRVEECGLSGAILPKQTVSLAIIERYAGVLEKKTTMERQCVCINLDIPRFHVRDKHTGC